MGWFVDPRLFDPHNHRGREALYYSVFSAK